MKKVIFRTLVDSKDVVFSTLGSTRMPRLGKNAGIILIDCVCSLDTFKQVFVNIALDSFERKGQMYFSLPLSEFDGIVKDNYHTDIQDMLEMRIRPLEHTFPNTAFFDGIKDENTEAFNIYYRPTSGGDVYRSDGFGLFHLNSDYSPMPEKGQGIGHIRISSTGVCQMELGNNHTFIRTSDKPDEVSSNIYVRPYPDNGREMKLATIMKEIPISY